MRRYVVIPLAVCVMVLLVQASSDAAPSATSLETVEKQLSAKWDKVNTLTATLRGSMSVNMLFPQLGIEGSFPANGKLIYRRNGAADSVRVELGSDLSQGVPLARFLGVLEGNQAYTETTLLGEVSKDPILPATPENGAAAPGGRSLFRALHAHFSLAVDSTQKLNGKDVYVINGVPKNASEMDPLAQLRLYFDTATGIVLYATGFDKNRVALAVLEITEIRCNETKSAVQPSH